MNPAKQGFLESLFKKANDLYSRKRYEDAIDLYRQILAQYPQEPSVRLNLGAALFKIGNIEDAYKIFTDLIEEDPTNLNAWLNRGDLLKKSGRYDEAYADFSTACKIDDESAEAHLFLGLLQLLKGDYKEGWKHFGYREKRLKLPGFPFPRWRAEAGGDRTILVVTEQGLGDTLQLVRFDAVLRNMGLFPFWSVRTPLVGLLKQNGIEAFDERILDTLCEKNSFDFYTYAFDIPAVLEATPETLYAPSRYLQTKSTLNVDSSRFNVAFAHKGNPEHAGDRFRSMPLETFAPILENEKCDFYSTQLDIDQKELISLKRENLFDTAPLLEDFADTAAVINSMDLVITVDTSLAHLAGAMGKPVWLLLPHVPDWRWGLDTSKTPWYPSIELFRQTAINEWEPVVQRVVHKLKERTK